MIHIRFIFSFLMLFQIQLICAQLANLDTFEYRIILAEDSTFFYQELHDRGWPIVIKSKGNSKKDKPVSSLYLAIEPRKEMTNLVKYTNFQIYNDNIFSVVYRDQVRPNWEYRADLVGWVGNYMSYYLEVNDNRNYYFWKPEYKGYLLFANKLRLDNYVAVTDRRLPVFNYDFIIINREIFLLTQIENEIFTYRNDNVNALKNSNWILQHCIQAPFDQEYFIIAKNAQGQQIIHTKTQGEYLLTDFATSPKITKLNDEPLGTKIFLEDKRTNKTHQLTRNEYKKIKTSKNHIEVLDSVLKNKYDMK